MTDSIDHGYTVIFLGDSDPPSRLLLLRRSLNKKFAPNWYTGIGGKVELGEDPLSGAKRELNEETGISEASLVEFSRVLVNGNGPRILFYFFGVTDMGAPPPCTEGMLEWCDVDCLLGKHLLPNTLVLLEHWRARRWNTTRPFTLFLTRNDAHDLQAPLLSCEMREGLFDN